MRPWELAAMAWQSWSMSTFSVVKRERSAVAAIILFFSLYVNSPLLFRLKKNDRWILPSLFIISNIIEKHKTKRCGQSLSYRLIGFQCSLSTQKNQKQNVELSIEINRLDDWLGTGETQTSLVTIESHSNNNRTSVRRVSANTESQHQSINSTRTHTNLWPGSLLSHTHSLTHRDTHTHIYIYIRTRRLLLPFSTLFFLLRECVCVCVFVSHVPLAVLLLPPHPLLAFAGSIFWCSQVVKTVDDTDHSTGGGKTSIAFLVLFFFAVPLDSQSVVSQIGDLCGIFSLDGNVPKSINERKMMMMMTMKLS
jgi:hypothetical protein